VDSRISAWNNRRQSVPAAEFKKTAVTETGRMKKNFGTQTDCALDNFKPYHYTNSDGAKPNNVGGLILANNVLYGTAAGGGTSGRGTVLALSADGTGLTNLHNFTGASDGAHPYSGLLLSGNTLYGTTAYGGSSSVGTVFKVNTDGTGFMNLHSFTGGDGENPYPSLILSGNTLYGTANRGGSSGQGTVFKVNTDGTGFTNLHNFAGYPTSGAYPTTSLVLSGNTLYGTTSGSGLGSAGTVFALNTNGTGFTNLYNFTATSGPLSTNRDGAYPGGLILSGNTLYGAAGGGGSSGVGTVFALNKDGTGLTNLHNFAATSGPLSTNSDGASPGVLFLSGTTLYGGTASGGSSGEGTVFALNTNGTGFTNLYSLTESGSSAGSLLAGNTLYGTTFSGGSSDNGTVFSRSLLLLLPPPPQLTLIPYGANVILTWPADAAGFTLQSTTNLVSPAVWSSVSPGPVIIGGQKVVFNPTIGAQKFYRLIQ
jgi:uncharacterized repeat protein (TIGR03803 family)